jgi:CzcA family heavy metal efflux pump
MKLAEISVRKPVTTLMIYVAVIVMGLMSLTRLGLDLMPKIEIPAVSVITAYEGAGPEEIETLLTKPIEDVMSTISGVDEVTSVSKEGVSTVTLKFKWGENIDSSLNDVREKLDSIRERLPEEADNPMIFKFEMDSIPICIIAVTAKESYPNLQTIVDKQIIDPLKRVNGVAAATARGGLERQIRVDIDSSRLAAFNISVAQIQGILAMQNMSLPGGNIRTGYKDYLLRTPEEFSDAKEVGEVVIAERNGIGVKLKDVAEVRDFFREKTIDVRVNGKTAMAIMIQKQSGGNTVEVANAVKKEMENIKKNLPADVDAQIVMDSSEFITSSIMNLRDSVMWAILFVFLVILFLVGDFRASVIVAASIPISLIISFFMMYLVGYTINSISLASLAVAVGMVVDNAIVVVDNVYRHRMRGQKAAEGAIHGTNEVGVAVMASTLTTIAIFAPIIFVGGIAAIIFGQFAAILTITLTASLFTAIMLVPMLCSKFLKVRQPGSRSPLDFFYGWGNSFLVWLEDLYVRFLNWAIDNRKTVIATCVMLLVWSMAAVKFVGMEFFPKEDQNRLTAEYELPIGTRYEKTGEVAEQLEKILANNVPERKASFIRWGAEARAEGSAMSTEEESYTGLMYVMLTSKKDRSASPEQIIERLRKITDKIPGAVIRYSSDDPLQQMVFGSGGQLTIELYGNDMVKAGQYARAVKEAITGIKGLEDVKISREDEKPEVKIVVDREKASKFGLDVKTIGKTIETYFAGTTATRYREGGDEYDIELRFQPKDRNQIEDLRDVTISLPNGSRIGLSNIAKIEYGLGPTKIERKDQGRYISVSGSTRGRDLGSIVKDVRSALAKVPAPSGFSYELAGAEKERSDAFRLLVMAAGLGMILVYMVMASQFESYRDPFIIFLSVPFGIVGVVLSLAVTGVAMSIMTFIALILLVGVVVNNGIVLISFIGILRHRGYDIRSAIVDGGRSRLRPILSTTITTILGMVPLLLSKGEGSESWMPFALTSIGGLSLSTIVTLILMPTLYSWFEGYKPAGVKG